MAEVRNCKRCGAVFYYLGGVPLCQACKDKDEEDFKRVKEYLYENPGATLSEVATALDLSVEKIKFFLKEGRLEITNTGGNVFLECEVCGKAIRTGRYCDECSKEIEKKLRVAADSISSELARDREKREQVFLRYLKKDK